MGHANGTREGSHSYAMFLLLNLLQISEYAKVHLKFSDSFTPQLFAQGT